MILIGVIATVVVTVALPELGDARSTGARELIGGATVCYARARRVSERLDSTGTHALVVLHDHTIRAQTDEAVVGRTQADVRALSVVGAAVVSGLYAVGKYLKKYNRQYIL